MFVPLGLSCWTTLRGYVAVRTCLRLACLISAMLRIAYLNRILLFYCTVIASLFIRIRGK